MSVYIVQLFEHFCFTIYFVFDKLSPIHAA